MHIALWLELNPRQPLLGEGIATHLARLVGVWGRQENTRVTAFVPLWNKNRFEEYANAFGLFQLPGFEVAYVRSLGAWFDRSLDRTLVPEGE